MARSQYNPAFFNEAEKRLEALADSGEYLRVLELLRRMEKSILKCHTARVPVQRIWMELTDVGAVVTRQHFTKAYRIFMEEKGLTPQPWRASPRRPDLPQGTLPADRRLPPSREIAKAVKELQGDVSKAATSLDLITKDL